MEEELNYLSIKVEELDEMIDVGVGIDFTHNDIEQLKKEKQIVENILNVVTIQQLT